MSSYEPSPLGLALLKASMHEATKEEAMGLVKETGMLARRLVDEIVATYGNNSLYVMQSVGELMLATVNNTIKKISASNTH